MLARSSDPIQCHDAADRARQFAPSRRAMDLTGHRYGQLTVLAFSGRDAKGATLWNCVCDCGAPTTCRTRDMRSGNTTSCGCVGVRRRAQAAAAANTTHGMSASITYEAWSSMKRRCYEETHKSFHRYGGRGIAVCGRWLGSFESFLSDMGERPSAAHTLDRLDGDGHYEPANCRWATPKQQARNRSNNVVLAAFGESKLLIEWTEDPRCSVTFAALQKRLAIGWDAEKAISTPKYATRSKRGTPSGGLAQVWEAV